MVRTARAALASLASLALAGRLLAAPGVASVQRGAVSLEVPRGWEVHVAGQCTLQAFVARDPAEPRRQVFHFMSVGPVYLSEQQRRIDMVYQRTGGFPVPHAQMPTVQPLDGPTFLRRFQALADTTVAQSFLPARPRLAGLEVVAARRVPSASDHAGMRTDEVRAVFTHEGRPAEGLFRLTLGVEVPFTGGPGGATGRAWLFSGVSAPYGELGGALPALTEVLASFRFVPGEVERCLRVMGAQAAGIQEAGKTLREASAAFQQGWEDRKPMEDAIARRFAHRILGIKRPEPETKLPLEGRFQAR